MKRRQIYQSLTIFSGSLLNFISSFGLIPRKYFWSMSYGAQIVPIKLMRNVAVSSRLIRTMNERQPRVGQRVLCIIWKKVSLRGSTFFL